MVTGSSELSPAGDPERSRSTGRTPIVECRNAANRCIGKVPTRLMPSLVALLHHTSITAPTARTETTKGTSVPPSAALHRLQTLVRSKLYLARDPGLRKPRVPSLGFAAGMQQMAAFL